MTKVQKKITPHAGFTLMEMLISISVFMLFIGLVASSYISLVKANNTANDMQKLYRETRNVFDTFAAEIRNGAIDYSCVNPDTNMDVYCTENQNIGDKKVLGVLSKDGGKRSLFKEKNGKILFQKQTRDPSGLSWVYTSDWQALTAEKSRVEKLKFFISPLKNPYSAENAEDDSLQIQPSVTILLKINGYVFRTTYSSRTYGK